MVRGKRSALACAAGVAALAFACGTQGAVTAEEAKALGANLTGFGAERAGSPDGRIPAYTGGLEKAPAGYKAGDGRRVDPFAGEKPLYVLTAGSVGDAGSQLTEGTLEMLRRYPSFRVDVYATHRTVGYPHWLVENTRRNATKATATEGGLRLNDAFPGIPFPIPRDGNEVMWNHRLHYMGRAIGFKYDSWLVDASGQPTLTSTASSVWEFPAFEPKRDTPLKEDETLFAWKLDYTGPQRRAGEAMILVDSVNPLVQARRAWYYVPGQRRVKQVELPDDAPHSSSSGTYTNDDAFVYTGVLERFDLKLLGKREILVPYNTYRLTYHERAEDMLLAKHVNPDFLRWELHRVWVVEAKLKPGQHHVYSRRVFYVDEDSWAALASDEYDMDGKLLRAVFAFLTDSYDADAPFAGHHVAYDLSTGSYYFGFFPGAHSGVRYVEPLPASQWSPDSLAGAGVR
jgi:hypothetical protein